MPRPRPSIARTALLAFLVASVFLAGAGRPGLARDGRADEVPESREPIEIGDLVLSLPALDGFQELPGLSDQLKGHWAGRLGRASIRIGYRVYPLDRFGFHDPVEVIDMLESNYSRRNEGYELDERETIEGRFGRAPYAALGIGPLPSAQPGSPGRLMLLGGLLTDVGYSIEIHVGGDLRDAERQALDHFLRYGLESDTEAWDPDWTIEEIRERWARDVPFLAAREMKKPLRTQHYLILSNANAARTFGNAMEEGYKRVQKMFPFEENSESRLMPVFLFRTKDQYLDFYVHIAGTTRAQAARSKGHAWKDYYATYYESPKDPVHIHEATHQIFMNRLRLRGGGSWFQEGVAEYCSTSVNERKSFARRFAKDRKHVPLRRFMKMPALIEGDAQNTYLQAASLTEFLCDKWNRERFPTFVREIGSLPRNDLDAIDAALQEIYGTGIDGLEDAWLEYWSRR